MTSCGLWREMNSKISTPTTHLSTKLLASYVLCLSSHSAHRRQMRCSSVIFRSLNLARAKTEDTVSSSDDQSGLSAPGADDFLPLLIWVVLHCHVPRLVSNCEYIQSFHNPIHLRGKAGYCLVNLRSTRLSSFPHSHSLQVCDGVCPESGAPRHLPHDGGRISRVHGEVDRASGAQRMRSTWWSLDDTMVSV